MLLTNIKENSSIYKSDTHRKINLKWKMIKSLKSGSFQMAEAKKEKRSAPPYIYIYDFFIMNYFFLQLYKLNKIRWNLVPQTCQRCTSWKMKVKITMLLFLIEYVYCSRSYMSTFSMLIYFDYIRIYSYCRC